MAFVPPITLKLPGNSTEAQGPSFSPGPCYPSPPPDPPPKRGASGSLAAVELCAGPPRFQPLPVFLSRENKPFSLFCQSY